MPRPEPHALTRTVDFEGRPVVAVYWRGRWCWPVSKVGEAIGYEHGRRLATSIRGEWVDEFRVGKDFDRLDGDDAREFLALLNDFPGFGKSSSGRGGARSILVLYASGIDRALILSRTEKGRRLRDVIVDDVLPQLRETGTATLPGAPAPAGLEVVVSELAALRAEVAELKVQARPVAEPRTPHEELTDGTIGERRARSQIKDRINLIGALVANTRQGKAYARERKHTENYVRRLTGHQGPWHRLPEGLMGAATNAIDDEAARARRVVAALTSARQLPLPDDKGGKGPGSSD